MLKFKLLATVGLVLAAPIAAQLRLPVNPLVKAPTIEIPPLVFTEAPSGIVVVPVSGGTGTQSAPAIAIKVRTSGGSRSVTLAISVNGPNSSRFSLVDPPAVTSFGGNTIVAPATTGVQSINTQLEAPSVSKLVKITGSGSIPASLPADHVVTVTARDSGGSQTSRSFTVRFARAGGKPVLASTTQVNKQTAVDTSVNFNSAQLEVSPAGEVQYVPYNKVTLRPASGAAISWHPLDPNSEVICVYGTFRYACQVDSPPGATNLPATLTVRVPDIGRGNSVRIVLKGPYGDSDAVPVTIDSLSSVILRQQIPTGTLGGTRRFVEAPAIRSSAILKNADPVKCDMPYLVWKDLTTASQVFYKAPPGALPISLKFEGEATTRVISVPRNERITDDPDESWAVMESNVPVGITNFYVQDLAYKYTTQVGECAERRR